MKTGKRKCNRELIWSVKWPDKMTLNSNLYKLLYNEKIRNRLGVILSDRRQAADNQY